MVLETLGWGKEAREDINFVLESRLNFTQPTDVNWRNLFSVKMAPISALLVTLGQTGGLVFDSLMLQNVHSVVLNIRRRAAAQLRDGILRLRPR